MGPLASPCAHSDLNALKARGSIVPRPTPGSKDLKRHPMVCDEEFLIVALKFSGVHVARPYKMSLTTSDFIMWDFCLDDAVR